MSISAAIELEKTKTLTYSLNRTDKVVPEDAQGEYDGIMMQLGDKVLMDGEEYTVTHRKIF